MLAGCPFLGFVHSRNYDDNYDRKYLRLRKIVQRPNGMKRKYLAYRVKISQRNFPVAVCNVFCRYHGWYGMTVAHWFANGHNVRNDTLRRVIHLKHWQKTKTRTSLHDVLAVRMPSNANRFYRIQLALRQRCKLHPLPGQFYDNISIKDVNRVN